MKEKTTLRQPTNNLFSIKNDKVRNLLRGVLFDSNPQKLRSTLEKIKRNYSYSDYKESVALVRNSPFFEKNLTTREFSDKCTIGLMDAVKFTPIEISKRINLNSEKLITILSLISSSVVDIQNQNYSSAIDNLELAVKAKGVSCLLIRVMFFLNNRLDGIDKYNNEVKRLECLFDKVEVKNYRFMHSAIRELSNLRTDYFNIYKRINDTREKDPYSNIAKHFLNHIEYNEKVISDRLNSFLSVSLLDAFLYIMLCNRYHNKFKRHITEFNNEITEKFYNLSSININTDNYIYDKEENGIDLTFYRESFLLIEINDFYKYKTIMGSFYNTDEEKLPNRTPEESRLSNEYFSNINNLKDLSYNKNWGINLNKFNPKSTCFLENTCALIYLIEKFDGNIEGEADSFVELMSYTSQIGHICSSHYLTKLVRIQSNMEMALVAACLMSIKDRRKKSDHALRSIIQKYTISNFDSSLTKLIEHLYKISPSVTEHLVLICDETFISQLFHLIDKPNSAIEARAEMLEWYSKITGDEEFSRRSKNLKIDVQISKEKGTIDDSRIYVDPLKFTQWINDNVLNEITILLDNEAITTELFTSTINWDSANSGLKFSDQIATYLLRCYKEFCENEIFGIASYIGRRIRHGTFVGTGLKDIKDFYEKEIYSDLFSNKEFHDEFDHWVQAYNKMLTHIKEENLHINTKKKPDGFISSRLNTASKKKIADNLYLEIYNAFLKTDSRSRIPYLITEYCWRIIEGDLELIRRSLMEKKSKHACFKAKNTTHKKLDHKLLKSFEQEINLITTDKFRTISSWFSKPSFASPSTELGLLFNAVVSEVKGLIPNYIPIVVNDTSPITLNGGQYFAIYDSLFILIHNAAVHGNSTGLLEFNMTYNEKQKFIDISLTSEISKSSNYNRIKEKIEKKLSDDYKGAHTFEDGSGIKKLRQMKNDKYIDRLSYSFKENKVTANLSFSVGY